MLVAVVIIQKMMIIYDFVCIFMIYSLLSNTFAGQSVRNHFFSMWKIFVPMTMPSFRRSLL